MRKTLIIFNRSISFTYCGTYQFGYSHAWHPFRTADSRQKAYQINRFCWIVIKNGQVQRKSIWHSYFNQWTMMLSHKRICLRHVMSLYISWHRPVRVDCLTVELFWGYLRHLGYPANLSFHGSAYILSRYHVLGSGFLSLCFHYPPPPNRECSFWHPFNQLLGLEDIRLAWLYFGLHAFLFLR